MAMARKTLFTRRSQIRRSRGVRSHTHYDHPIGPHGPINLLGNVTSKRDVTCSDKAAECCRVRAGRLLPQCLLQLEVIGTVPARRDKRLQSLLCRRRTVRRRASMSKPSVLGHCCEAICLPVCNVTTDVYAI